MAGREVQGIAILVSDRRAVKQRLVLNVAGSSSQVKVGVVAISGLGGLGLGRETWDLRLVKASRSYCRDGTAHNL